MATADDNKTQCIICGREKRTFRCDGCLKTFCLSHLPDHHEELSQQLYEIEADHDLFRQRLTEHINDPNKNLLMDQITEWEKDSIQKIQQTANECRQRLFQLPTNHTNRIETDLAELTKQIRKVRQEDDFNETDLNYFKAKLTYSSTRQIIDIHINKFITKNLFNISRKNKKFIQ